MLKYQINNNIQYLCFIEDDLIIEESFPKFVEDKIHFFHDNHSLKMIRLGAWGEGYITSLKGAERILEHIYKLGINENIDNQLRNSCGHEMPVEGTPWKVMVTSNNGEASKTQK